MRDGLHLKDLFDLDLFARMREEGYVRVQDHPELPLQICNYSEKTQYERVWNPVTLTCRGLIIDHGGYVVARPFEKFFNYSEHPDGALDLNAEVMVADKLDGCFPRQTTLNLWGGGTITIGEVVRKKLPVTLVGMNEHGELVPSTVTDWHHNGRKDHWLDIEIDAPVSRLSGAAGHANRLRVTPNHHIMVNGSYVPACEIEPGDTVVTQAWIPSKSVIRLVRASLLGDGCLVASSTKPEQAKYQEPHSEKQEDYVSALHKALGDCAASQRETLSGHGSRMVWAGSREYEAFGRLRREWYPEGVKRVPADLSWMDGFAVAKWLMDDGHRAHSAFQRDLIVFATHSFTFSDVQRLADRLAEMYGVSCTVYDDRGPNLRVNAGRDDAINRLWADIAPHVHPSLSYKLPEQFRDVPYAEPPIGYEIAKTRKATVLSVTNVEPTKANFPHGRSGFDITTTTHNYMARGILVHNSLGILYPTADGHAIATRGSFTSDQALHATKVWQERYAGTFVPHPDFTYLFEIIYPGNRIVCDYGDQDDLVLLGAVENWTAFCRPASLMGWPGLKVTEFPYPTLAEALAAPPRPGAEGLVVTFGDGSMVKLKQADYVALHKIVTGLNARVVWEQLAEGKQPHEICEPLPDEFHPWVRDVCRELNGKAMDLKLAAKVEHVAILMKLPPDASRKDYAEHAKKSPFRALLFRLLDGRDISEPIWKQLRPPADDTPFTRSL